MNYKKYILIYFCFPILLNAQYLWQIKKDTVVTWYYQTGDEFSEPELNLIKWQTGLPWGNAAMSQDVYFDKENIELKNGEISFISKKEKKTMLVNEWEIDKKYLEESSKKVTDGKFDFEYTTGLISSKQKFKYGYFEIRFKANDQRGIWPAFWLFGGEPNEEIDFFELKGEKNKQVHIDVHCKSCINEYKTNFIGMKKNWGAWIKTNGNISNNWNIISGEWQPNYVKFFLNGQPMGYFEGNFKTSQTLIINSSVAKNKKAFGPGPDETTKWPNSFTVDYVRVWSSKDTIYDMKYDYKYFSNSKNNLDTNTLYVAQPKGKDKLVYSNKNLNDEIGNISILPIFYNQYSLSIVGNKLGKIQIDVLDNTKKIVANYEIENTKYYILDLSKLPTGPYDIKIHVLNHTLTQNFPVINPAKIGDQK